MVVSCGNCLAESTVCQGVQARNDFKAVVLPLFTVLLVPVLPLRPPSASAMLCRACLALTPPWVSGPRFWDSETAAARDAWERNFRARA
mmetsp:Transcript_49730/g.118439  ORF Transcript_49730/g.118439 Transcript_49730/m.118439 type:complete len:89 (-) Transcript_49730:733-999(-)